MNENNGYCSACGLNLSGASGLPAAGPVCARCAALPPELIAALRGQGWVIAYNIAAELETAQQRLAVQEVEIDDLKAEVERLKAQAQEDVEAALRKVEDVLVVSDGADIKRRIFATLDRLRGHR